MASLGLPFTEGRTIYIYIYIYIRLLSYKLEPKSLYSILDILEAKLYLCIHICRPACPPRAIRGTAPSKQDPDGYLSEIANGKSQTANRKLQTAGHKPQTASCNTKYKHKYKHKQINTYWLPDHGFQILATRSWLPGPGFQILVTRSRQPDLGHQIHSQRFWNEKNK